MVSDSWNSEKFLYKSLFKPFRSFISACSFMYSMPICAVVKVSIYFTNQFKPILLIFLRSSLFLRASSCMSIFILSQQVRRDSEIFTVILSLFSQVYKWFYIILNFKRLLTRVAHGPNFFLARPVRPIKIDFDWYWVSTI